jgi:hypothetical protein
VIVPIFIAADMLPTSNRVSGSYGSSFPYIPTLLLFAYFKTLINPAHASGQSIMIVENYKIQKKIIKLSLLSLKSKLKFQIYVQLFIL